MNYVPGMQVEGCNSRLLLDPLHRVYKGKGD